MKHLDLFSGIGGFSLAAKWVWGEDHEIHSFVEIDPFCQKVLKKHWPNVPIHSDIKDYKHDGTTIDLLTGGFPCQPFSKTGKLRGKEDDRYLWPAMLEQIQKIHPSWVIGENVVNITNMGLENMAFELENIGYKVALFNIPSCAIGSYHRRSRIWIIANLNIIGMEVSVKKKVLGIKTLQDGQTRISFQDVEKRFNLFESRLCRSIYGIPDGVDRIRALGNAIVPQVVVPIMEVIKEIEKTKTNQK